jgi:hypothetical protein
VWVFVIPYSFHVLNTLCNAHSILYMPHPQFFQVLTCVRILRSKSSFLVSCTARILWRHILILVSAGAGLEPWPSRSWSLQYCYCSILMSTWAATVFVVSQEPVCSIACSCSLNRACSHCNFSAVFHVSISQNSRITQICGTTAQVPYKHHMKKHSSCAKQTH